MTSMTKKSQGRAAALVMVSGLSGILGGCGHGAADEGAAGSKAVARVTLARVARAAISSEVKFTVSVAALPNLDVRVSALVPGRIAELRVAEGDRVSTGQLLARLGDQPLRDQLQQAEGAAAQAQANLENAKQALARNEDLFQRGIAARKELENARTQARVYEAALSQAQAALSSARLQLARAEIHSPLSGTVVKRFVSAGEQVDGTAAQPIVEVADTREVELQAQLPTAELGLVRAGQALMLTTDTPPAQQIHGRVAAVAASVDPQTGLGLVRIRVANANGALKLGMFLTVNMAGETHSQALVVASKAVYRDQEGSAMVYRVDGTTATAVPVKTGIEAGGRIELLSGAREGDTIILTGGYGLGDKAEISVEAGGKP
jgi:membrane fusion protein, multidrug efflux system